MKIEIELGKDNLSSEALIGVLAAILAIIGSIGPWATVTSFLGNVNANGTSGDGKITLALSIGALFWLVRYLISDEATTGTLVWVSLLFAGTLALAYNISSNLGEVVETESAAVSVDQGWGLTLVLIASFVGMVDVGYAAFKSWQEG